VFKNIPFAAPPVGELRWRPPQPPAPWEGVRDGSEYGAVCPQPLFPGFNKEALGQYPMSEDCLNLNVWTPGLDGEARLPVMVWLLPGGFMVGAAQLPTYDGAGLAGQGVVVVTFNNRLGFLGQFAHPAMSYAQANKALGNYNLMDQIAALEWVRDNIAAFGGDPDNVTIFGMSSGGVAVNYLMAMPAARGLFHRAISQSSAIRVSSPRHISREVLGVPSLESTGEQVAAKAGLEGDAVLDGLRALSWERVLELQSAIPPAAGSMNPVVDGRLVVESVGKTFREGRQAPVPYVAGAASWEGSLLARFDDADPILRNFRITRENAVALYGDVDERTLLDNLEVDFFFGSQRYLVKHHAATGHPAYLYLFSRVLESSLGRVAGASHGAETPYVFKTLDTLEAAPPPFGGQLSASDRDYAETVSAYWVGFARSGDPNGDGRPRWPPYGQDGQDLLLELAQDEPVVRQDFLADRMKYFEAHFDAGKL
jgi:para-nitrobenzyl esterase